MAVGKGEESAKTIVEHVGVLSVFVENDARNFDVANFRIENGSFTKNIDTFDLKGVFKQFTENMIGGKAERIVDIDDKRFGLTKSVRFFNFKTRIAMLAEIGNRKDLDRGVEIVGRKEGTNAKFFLNFGEFGFKFGAILIKTENKIEKVRGRQKMLARFDFSPDLIEIRTIGFNKSQKFFFDLMRKISVKIEKTVSVAANKIDGRFGKMNVLGERGSDVF